MAGRLIDRRAPVLPALPADSKVSGATVLHTVVGSDGLVEDGNDGCMTAV